MAGKIARDEVPCPLHALDAELYHVLDFHRLMSEERLAIAGTNQRAVMRILDFDEGVEVLAGGEDLAGGLGAVELARVALDRRQLVVELLADVHHERGL